LRNNQSRESLSIRVQWLNGIPMAAVFSSFFGASKRNSQETASWLIGLGGYRGPQSVVLSVARIGEVLSAKAGVFVFASRDGRGWRALYVGETSDLNARARAHEILPEAILLGATHVHTAQVQEAPARCAIAEKLIFEHGPPLNAADAPLLPELIAEGIAKPLPIVDFKPRKLAATI
jgi:hypothetical protein